jgi:hypothetical protein
LVTKPFGISLRADFEMLHHPKETDMRNSHLLVQEVMNGRVRSEHTAEYLPEEMEDIFTPHERLWLAEGKIVENTNKYGVTLRYADMIVATRKLFK